MAHNGLEVNTHSDVISLEDERKRRQRKRRNEEAIAEGRIGIYLHYSDGVLARNIELHGAGADLFKRMLAAGDSGLFPSEITLEGLDALRWVGIPVRRVCDRFSRLRLDLGTKTVTFYEGIAA